MSNSIKSSGNIKWFNRKRGFGFIATEKAGDVYVHYTNILSDTKQRYLLENETVVFELVDGQATKVTAPEGSKLACSQPKPVSSTDKHVSSTNKPAVKTVTTLPKQTATALPKQSAKQTKQTKPQSKSDLYNKCVEWLVDHPAEFELLNQHLSIKTLNMSTIWTIVGRAKERLEARQAKIAAAKAKPDPRSYKSRLLNAIVAEQEAEAVAKQVKEEATTLEE